MKLMKITILVCIYILDSLSCKEMIKHKKSNFKKSKSKQLIIPTVQNYSNIPSDPYVLQRAAGFKNPQIFNGDLPEKLSPYPFTGVFTHADVSMGPGPRTYYNGADTFSKHVSMRCGIIVVPIECTLNQRCGWCGENRKCISGTPIGPMEPCMRKQYIFNAPSKDWDPLNSHSYNAYAETRGIPKFQATWNPRITEIAGLS